MAEGAAQDAASLGVNVKLGTAVTAVEGGKYAAKALLSDGSFIELGEHDPVIFCVGVRPVTGIFEGTELAMDKDGIIIDSRMRTNIEGVLAVGDCASFVSYIDGRPAGGKLATNAVPMGKIAAYNLIGRNYEYKGFINGAITKTKNLRMGGTGFTEEEAKNRGYSVICGFGETTTRFPIMPEVKKVKVKLVADTATGRIIGGQVVGGEGIPGRIDTISLAIQNAMTAGELFNFSYCAQPYQSFFPAGNAIVMAAEMIMNKMEKQPIG
jgi:NADPH-dependent 2,4-dienoyl-CoA reductase/sulfur reductase-like enzyme